VIADGVAQQLPGSLSIFITALTVTFFDCLMGR